jgi:hypothetical protein
MEYKILFSITLFLVFIFFGNTLYAACLDPCTTNSDCNTCGGGDYICKATLCVKSQDKKTLDKVVNLTNPLGKDASTDVNVLIGKIINGVLGIVGSLALVMFIYGGFVWMTARGNRDAITKGKDILVWAIIGMVVIFTSYAAVSFVLKNVVQSEATENQGQNP